MLRAMKYLLAVATLLSLTFPARAQKVDFEVGAPGVVAVGEAFRIEFTVNAKPDGFTPPAFGGFDVLAGPTTSEGTSVSIVNGHVSKTVSFTYTYVLQAQNEGLATISAASVQVEGKTYSTQPLTIEVVSGEAMPGQGGASAGGADKKADAEAERQAGSGRYPAAGDRQSEQCLQGAARTGSLQTLYAGATERNRERQVSCFQRFLGAGAQRRRLQLAAGDAERQGLRRPCRERGAALPSAVGYAAYRAEQHDGRRTDRRSVA